MQNTDSTQILAQALQRAANNNSSSNNVIKTELSNNEKDSDDGRKVGKWTSEEDELLKKYVPIYGEKQWRKVAEHIPGRTSIQCLHRWTKILKPGLVKGPWTTEEDQKLIAWVKAEGPTKWAQCANFIKGRSGKQCRERWFNNLNPGVKKGNWTKEEDELIFELYQKYGSSWSKIAKYINGRTENAIKNRFYSTLRKLAADKRKHKGENVPSESGPGDETFEEESTKEKNSDPAQGPNALYKLLQEKTCTVESTKDKTSENVKQEVISPQTNLEEKPKQAFNINGEKFVVVRDHQVPEKDLQEAAAKLASNDLDDNDLAFEKFLVSMDGALKDDFITKEFNPNNSDFDDITQFDKLQKKILVFCQNNISDLTEAFKNVANNRIDNPNAPIKTKIITRSVIPIESIPSPTRPKLDHPITSGSILTPTPTTPRDKPFNLTGKGMTSQTTKGPSGTAFNLYNHPSMNSNPLLSMMQNPQLQQMQGMNIEPSVNKNTELLNTLSKPAAQPKINSLINTMNNSLNTASTAHASYVTNLMDMIHQVQTEKSEETERRMTFLFQQLYSLESLLTNTRNELMKLESTIKKDDKRPGGTNTESTKIEEERVYDDVKAPGNLHKLNTSFEQLLKTKK